MHRIISAEQLRILLNDTRKAMGDQPWTQATDDHSHEPVNIPHGKMEALQRLEHNEWVFVPVIRTQRKNGKLLEHGFEIHRRENGWEVKTAVLEIPSNQPATVHEEPARNHAVQSELEKLRLRISKPKTAEAQPAA